MITHGRRHGRETHARDDRELPSRATSFNEQAAAQLDACGRLLREQHANPFRVNAYLRAAKTLLTLERDAREILDHEGLEGLQALPGIGRGLAAAIEELARTGRLSRLERLRGATDPEALFRSVPGIGPGLSHAIHETLHIDTLEALELAAHDGRLESVPGVGPRRLAGIRASLAAMLGRRPRPRPATSPGIAELLDVDREYRERAARRDLPTVAPRRFNPDGAAWLPVLHAERGGWHFTALFSNTALAHELGRTHDWVVLYFYDGDHDEGQHTIVTETTGHLEGLRVVRGRERECAEYYRSRRD